MTKIMQMSKTFRLHVLDFCNILVS